MTSIDISDYEILKVLNNIKRLYFGIEIDYTLDNKLSEMYLDVLDHVDFIIAIEETFNIHISDEDYHSSVTFEDLINLIIYLWAETIPIAHT